MGHYTHASVIDESSFRKALKFSAGLHSLVIITIFNECASLEMSVDQI